MRHVGGCLLAVLAGCLAVFFALPIIWLYATTIGEFWFG